MRERNNVLNVYMKKPDWIQSVLGYFLDEKLADDWVDTCVDDDGFLTVKNTFIKGIFLKGS